MYITGTQWMQSCRGDGLVAEEQTVFKSNLPATGISMFTQAKAGTDAPL